MGVYEYRGEPGLGYLYLATAAGTAPHTDLKPGDTIDFGELEPPDNRWVQAAEGAAATKLPDNHPDNQPVVQYPELEPEDAEPEDAKPTEAEPAPADTAPATDTPKRSKTTPAKTTA